MSGLLNLLAPTLFILLFYALLALVVRQIFRPTPWPSLRRAHLPKLPWSADPVTRRTQTIAASLTGIGLLGLILPLPIPFQIIMAQGIGIAALLLIFDSLQHQRRDQDLRRQLLDDLHSGDPARIRLALHQLRRADSPIPELLRQRSWAGVAWAESDLSGLDLTGLDLAGADLRAANLSHTILRHTRLEGADLTRANLAHADLSHASLRQVQAKRANFTATQLAAADLTAAQCPAAIFDHADLRAAVLTRANLKQAALDTAQLIGATYDDTTKWPKHFVPPSALASRAVATTALPEQSRT